MNMVTFFFRKVLLFCVPFLVLILVYIILDPFKIIFNYDNYYDDSIINTNRDFVSTEMYLKNSEKNVFDSFIFSGSEAMYLRPSMWGKYISTTNKAFSFDAYSENIYGIWSKINFLHKKNHRIKNALVMFDNIWTFREFTNEGHIFMKHYKVYPSSKYKLHYVSFLSFLRPEFLFSLIQYKISNEFYPSMADVFERRMSSIDLVSNEVCYIDPELRTDSLGYYEKRKHLFLGTRSDNILEVNQQINEDHIQMLKEINEIFITDSTDFRILIIPVYSQNYFNKNDLKILQNIFGEKNIYDFSGVNKYSERMSDYDDPGHFKMNIAEELLKEIYK